MKNSIGQHLRALRLAQDLTQSQLSEMAGVDQSDISRIETGRTVDSEMVAALQRVLSGDEVIAPQTSAVEPHSNLIDLFRPARPRWVAIPPDVPLAVRLNQARLSFGRDWVSALMSRLATLPHGDRITSILESLNLDSSHEFVFLCRLLIEGWEFARARPLSVGCRWLIRDRYTFDYIGDAPRWVLLHSHLDGHVLLIPQVSMVATAPYRLDFPGVVVRGNKRAELLVEVDGPLHATESQRERDLLRTIDVDLPTLRITEEELKRQPKLSLPIAAFALPLCKTKLQGVKRWA